MSLRNFPKSSLTPGDRVIHHELGLGRVLDAARSFPDRVTVKWPHGVREASTDSLRRLLPRTVLGQLVARTTSHVSTWTVRKADEQGTIQPDAKGRFAGHDVHFYDPDRIPALIEQLSQRDLWRIGTLVIHSHHGPGRVAALGPEQPSAGVPTQTLTRRVHFFADKTPLPVPVGELRHLISGSVVANRIGVQRKSFAKLATRKGIWPDYSSDGGFREFYDEGRIEEIRRRWGALPQYGSLQPGRSIVLDSSGDIARIESMTADGKARLRYIDYAGALSTAPVSELRELASLREFARRENMSRYKLQRLLRAVNVGPVYEHGGTMYFDVSETPKILHGRLAGESSAVSLRVLSRRTGVSRQVLARKIRRGCIRTTGQQGTYCVDEQEAQRIEELVAALRGLRGWRDCRI